LQYIAPYAGCAIGEHLMYQGKDVLCAYDDLTKQAAAYREISLLLRRPPGREAYPGDVFYLHSRLLERACKLAVEYVIVRKDTPESGGKSGSAGGEAYRGPVGLRRAEAAAAAMPGGELYEVRRRGGSGGSMTALPICETQEGEVSAYIPTNLISITDGQIYLEPSLFFAGVRPAVNVGISVSRVGYKAAYPAMKTVAASLRLDLAAYRELEAFAQLGMELDPAAQQQLDRGERMVRLLTQPQFRPRPAIDQAIAIFAGARGLLDDLPPEEVSYFEEGALAYIKESEAEFYAELNADKSLPPERRRRLRAILEEYKGDLYRKERRARRRDADAETQPEAKVEADADAETQPEAKVEAEIEPVEDSAWGDDE